jgi:sugar-specific transcriptional regulator TrmB
MNNEIKHNLKELGFSESEVKVYMALTVLGEAKASQVAKKADLPRTTVISILDRLISDNFITSHTYRGTIYYWVESPKTLANILAYRLEIANKLNLSLSNLYREEAHFPEAEVFDTKSKIKNAIEKIITNLKKGSAIYTIDTPETGNYAKIFSGGSEESIMGLKKKKDIITHTLVPKESFRGIAGNKLASQNIKIRELPLGVKFSGSLWIIKNQIAHFSGNPPFLVLIKHENIVGGIKAIFDFLWNISEIKN